MPGSARRIVDPADPAVESFRSIPDRALRADGGRFVVESPRVVERFLDSLASSSPVGSGESLLVDPARAPGLVERGLALGLAVFEASDQLMTDLSGYHFHGGALALGRRSPRLPTLDRLVAPNADARPRRLFVALEAVTSMDNMGSIFRTAAALGADGILLDHACSDPLLRRCLRISMGQVFRVPWTVTGSLSDVLPGLRESFDLRLVALENLPDAPLLGSDPPTSLAGTTVVVVGNEGHGLSSDTIEACDAIRRIPGPADLPDAERPGGEDERSLNASIAAAIAMYAILGR